jgi:hypothetical protein
VATANITMVRINIKNMNILLLDVQLFSFYFLKENSKRKNDTAIYITTMPPDKNSIEFFPHTEAKK